MDEYLKNVEKQLESYKAHAEDMISVSGDVWSKDVDSLRFAIDVVDDLRKGYKLCRVDEVLEVIAQICWKNHDKYGADVIDLENVAKIIRDGCKLRG